MIVRSCVLSKNTSFYRLKLTKAIFWDKPVATKWHIEQTWRLKSLKFQEDPVLNDHVSSTCQTVLFYVSVS